MHVSPTWLMPRQAHPRASALHFLPSRTESRCHGMTDQVPSASCSPPDPEPSLQYYPSTWRPSLVCHRASFSHDPSVLLPVSTSTKSLSRYSRTIPSFSCTYSFYRFSNIASSSASRPSKTMARILFVCTCSVRDAWFWGGCTSSLRNTKSTVNKIRASNKATLTYDVIEYVLAYTNIGHVENTLEVLGAHLNEPEKEELKYTRENDRPVFKDLTDNAEELEESTTVANRPPQKFDF